VHFSLGIRLEMRPRLRAPGATWLAGFLTLLAWSALAQAPSALPDTLEVVPRQIPMHLSESQGLRFRPLATEEGITQVKAAAAEQDDLGFLWFATPFGLNRYDGYSMKTYQHQVGDPASIACSNVRLLFKDQSHNLWAACDESLDRFNPRTETFTHYPLPPSGSSDPLVKITSIQEDPQKILWIATHSGLYSLNPQTGQTQHFTHRDNDPSTLNSDNADFIVEDQGQFSWVDAGKELNRFDRRTGKVTSHVTFSIAHTILGLHTDRFGITWVIRTDAACSIAQLDLPHRTLNCLNLQDSGAHSVMRGGTYSMFEDRDGRMWFSTMVDGLMRYDRANNQIVRYRSEANNDSSLRSDSLRFVTEDRDGGMWAGFYTGGIERFSLSDPQVQTYTQKRGNLAGNFVTSIYEDQRGVLWIGSFGALNRIDRHNGKNEIAQGPGLNGDVFLTMLEDGKGRLLTGTYRDSILELDPETGKFKKPAKPIVSPEVGKYPISRLLFDSHGVLWAATHAGLLRIDPLTGSPIVYRPENGAVDFTDIKEDAHGYLWLSGYSGLHRFDPRSRVFVAYRRRQDKPWEISDNLTNAVHVDRRGNVWVGTQNGLAELDQQSGFFTNYYKADGLAGEVVGSILEDRQGNLWLGTNHGLSRFNPVTRTFTTIYVGDGEAEPDLTGGDASFQSRDGEMFFGGSSGVIAFRPDDMLDDPSAPAVAITDLQIAGSSVPLSDGSALSTAIPYADAIRLRHSQSVFSVSFAGLNFKDPAHTRYRYQLVGVDRGWHDASSNQRVATYTTLPAGSYQLVVQASTVTSPWSNPGATLRIDVLPAWWNTWWFRSFFLFLVIVALRAAHRYRVQLMSDALALRLQDRAEERTRISRELHDTLMQTIEASRLIVHTATKPRTDPSQHRAALERLAGWLDRASDEGRAAMATLRSSLSDQGDLYDALRQTVEECGQQSIEVIFPAPPSRKTLRVLIQEEAFRIGAEAIRNACMHAEATRLAIELSFDPDLLLRVSDNGKGMDPAIASTGKEGHFGLRCIRERASRIGGRVSIESSPSTGTTVTLRVPRAIAFESESFDRPTVREKARRFLHRLRTSILSTQKLQNKSLRPGEKTPRVNG
jgi:ligand-binding sensor domain-containing protein/signal transduction histidine kinase